MDQLLQPAILDIDPEAPSAAKIWNHWRHKFENFTRSANVSDGEKLRLLINYVSSNIYEHVRCCSTYKDAVSSLKTCFSKPRNEIAARFRLFSRKQKSDEPIEKYSEALQSLSKDCHFSSEVFRDECLRDIFIAGLHSPTVRQRLLENTEMSFDEAVSQGRAEEMPHLESDHCEDDQGLDGAVSDDDSNEGVPPVREVAQEIIISPNASVNALIKLVRDNRKHAVVGNVEYTCYHCNMKFYKKGNLSKHMLNHFGSKIYECNHCGYKARLASALRYHVSIHTGERPFPCSLCEYKARLKTQLNRHMRVHTGEKPYACVLCGFRASMKVSLVKHVRRYHTGEKPYACTVCDYKTAQKHSLTMHMRSHTGEKPYACEFCDYRAAQRATLRLHMARHEQNPEARENKFACDQCEFRTYLKIYLSRHKWKSHKEHSKKLTCNICGYQAAFNCNMKKHMDIHNGEKLFKCPECDYTALRKAQLQLHMTTHSGERPFACEVCPYRTARKQHLTSHMRTHTGEKPYTCKDCGYRAAQWSTLASHMKTHNGAKLHVCTMCSYSTNKKSTLNQHLKTHDLEAPVHVQVEPEFTVEQQTHFQVQDVQVQEVQVDEQVLAQIQGAEGAVQWQPVQLQTATWQQGPPRLTTIAIPDLWSPGKF